MQRKIDFHLIGELLAPDRSRKQSLSEQIAVVIRYLIATNAIKPGDALPALREGAASLGVNPHTLRQAYRLLDDDGYVEIVPSVGVRTARFSPAAAGAPQPGSISEFLDHIEWEAKNRYGLDPCDLATLLCARAKSAKKHDINFIECSQGQAEMHAEQVAKIIGQDCRPVVIREGSPAPSGFSVTTLFHLDDIERIWPGRRADLHFVHINIASAMAQRVASIAPPGAIVAIVETDLMLGKHIARDLATIADRDPSDFTVRQVSGVGDCTFFQKERMPSLITPRLWNRLPEQIKARRNTEQILYDIDRNDARVLAAKYLRFTSGLQQQVH